MKEDLKMTADQLVTANTIWNCGYIIGQVPIVLVLAKVSPRWVIPTIELGWGILTLASYAVKNY